MPPQNEGKPIKRVGLVIAALLVVAILFGGLKFFATPPPEPQPAADDTATPTSESSSIAVEAPTVVDVGRVETDENLKHMMASRKEDYGTQNAVAAIVKADETIQIGDWLHFKLANASSRASRIGS